MMDNCCCPLVASTQVLGSGAQRKAAEKKPADRRDLNKKKSAIRSAATTKKVGPRVGVRGGGVAARLGRGGRSVWLERGQR